MTAPRSVIAAFVAFVLLQLGCDGKAMVMPGDRTRPAHDVAGEITGVLSKPRLTFAGGTFTTPTDLELGVEVDPDIALFTVELYDNDEPIAAMVQQPFIAPFTVDETINGTHTIFARVTDKYGDYSDSDPVVITVNVGVSDTVAPTIVITSPAATVSAAGPLTIAATATDDQAVAKVRFTVNGVDLGEDTNGADGWSISWSATSGLHNIVASAFDAAGNEGMASAAVRVDAQPVTDALPPTFGGLSLAAGQSASTVYLQWSAATDNLTAPSGIVYEIYRSTTSTMNWSTPIFTTAPGATSFTNTGLTAATSYYYAVRAKDAAGNHDNNQLIRMAATRAN